jgi:hypothetical protein
MGLSMLTRVVQKFVLMILYKHCLIDHHINQITVLNLELTSPTLPPGKKLIFDLTNIQSKSKDATFVIKEGVEYKFALFPVPASQKR